MKSQRGGYKIISFNSKTIYNDIEDNYLKTLLFTDIIIDGVEKADVFASVEVVGQDFKVVLYDKLITINQDNTITSVNYGLYEHNIEVYCLNTDGDNMTLWLRLYSNLGTKLESVNYFVDNYKNIKLTCSGSGLINNDYYTAQYLVFNTDYQTAEVFLVNMTDEWGERTYTINYIHDFVKKIN